MSISTLGWGVGALVTQGFGIETGRPEIPHILAKGLEVYAYTCVFGREYTEIQLREAETILQRSTTQILDRSTGWPWQSDPCLDDS